MYLLHARERALLVCLVFFFSECVHRAVDTRIVEPRSSCSAKEQSWAFAAVLPQSSSKISFQRQMSSVMPPVRYCYFPVCLPLCLPCILVCVFALRRCFSCAFPSVFPGSALIFYAALCVVQIQSRSSLAIPSAISSVSAAEPHRIRHRPDNNDGDANDQRSLGQRPTLSVVAERRIHDQASLRSLVRQRAAGVGVRLRQQIEGTVHQDRGADAGQSCVRREYR